MLRLPLYVSCADIVRNPSKRWLAAGRMALAALLLLREVGSTFAPNNCRGLPLSSGDRLSCLRSLIDAGPDYSTDSTGTLTHRGTTSRQFKWDLVSNFWKRGARQRVLELGCGRGETTAILAELFESVYVCALHSCVIIIRSIYLCVIAM